jgi:hypothetical protein
MTSRRPGTATSGTRALDDPETPGGTGRTGQEQAPGLVPGYYWPWVLVAALLITVGMAGLRGAVPGPHWNGPLWPDRAAIGVALEVIIGILLVIMLRRRAAALRARRAVGGQTGPGNMMAAKLRQVLIFVLGAGMIAVGVVIDNTLHLHVRVPKEPPYNPSRGPRHHMKPNNVRPEAVFHFALTAGLYGLLIVALVAAVLLSIWWSKRFQIAVGGREDGLMAADSDDLREAVESGRSMLRTVDDARAAIIACYVAMENSLAERGAARAVADTPDELLARAISSGIVRGPAAGRLTALFYKARFSSHPLGGGERDAAEQALDELAAALAEPREAKATP